LPNDEGHLWGILTGLDHESRMTLLAHCAALSVNAVQEPLNRNPRRLAHADTLARAVNLDMAASWSPTVDNYLGRVPKARILEAVREAKGDASAQLIDHLKKPDMAREAERLLAGTGWLPEPLRPQVSGSSGGGDDDESLPAFLDGSEDEEPGEDEPDDPAVIAAE
jgi:ParB family transcriptional regulator, chromosome partitioning protein